MNKDERFKKFDLIEDIEENGGKREKFIKKDSKDYGVAKELKKYIDKFLEKMENNLQSINEAKRMPVHLKKLVEPARLY